MTIIHLLGEQLTVISGDSSSHPHCKHGPTLLFHRQPNVQNKKIEKFYACSACRNRKECSFYLPVENLDQVKSDVQAVSIISCEKNCRLTPSAEKVFTLIHSACCGD